MAKKDKMKPAEVLALIVCESVVEDARTHNKCILNTYNVIWSHAFPFKQDRLTVFLALTNGHGKTPLDIHIQKTGAAEPVHPKSPVGRMRDALRA